MNVSRKIRRQAYRQYTVQRKINILKYVDEIKKTKFKKNKKLQIKRINTSLWAYKKMKIQTK